MQTRILIFLYALVGLVPYFQALDKVDTQIMYLNVINCLNIFLLFKSNRDKSFEKLQKSLSNLPVVFMGLFFLWSCITIIPAINKVESLISLSEIFTLLIALIFVIHNLSILDNSSRDKLIFYLILTLTSIELISVYTPYMIDVLNGSPQFQSLDYRGISGNVNVMSYSLLFKLPFLVYYLFKENNYKYYIYILIILISYAITTILQTRSAILSLILIAFILSVLFYILNNSRNVVKVFKKILLPISLGFILSFAQSNFITSSNLQQRVSTLLDAEDKSINERFRFYKAAFESFLDNPILGIGVGNWEIESVKYDRKEMDDYIVPYHAHNDYLEILAESGIPALIFYFGVLFFMIFIILKKVLSKSIKEEKDFFLIVIFCSTCVYLLDSMFNFPQARVLSQMNLILLLSISIFFIDLKFSVSTRLIKIFSFLFLALLPLSIYSSIRVFDSSKDQLVLLRQFNLNDFSKPSLDVVEKIQHNYPNITATGLPIASHKGLHFLKNDSIGKAVELFNIALPHHPYLMITETFLGYGYDELGQNEKGLYYTSKAFKNAPNDVIHFGNYINSLYELNDSIAIRNAYLEVPDRFKKPLHDELYLLVISSMQNPSSASFTLDGIDINYQAGNDRLKKGYYFAQVGQVNTYEANRNYFIAMDLFDSGNFSEAIKYFLIAADLNPYELVYLENAANSYMKLGDDEEALLLLNKLVNEFNATNPKVFYLRGLILYDSGRIDEACLDFKIANDAGLFGTTSFFSNYCN